MQQGLFQLAHIAHFLKVARLIKRSVPWRPYFFVQLVYLTNGCDLIIHLLTKFMSWYEWWITVLFQYDFNVV